ncbi:MAG: DNA polymerase III subunit gamma/tau [Planctomycetota bacterium]
MEESHATGSGDACGSDYVVVARRYRPQAFGELIGQEHIARALTQAITAGRIGHAYLFTGARGVGKTSAARIFAKALNCSATDGPTPSPCNACDICRSVSSGDDVDVLEIDGASNRGIDEIRQLRQNAGVRPSRARMKVYIIDEVHMLTKEAFNALLKTLEEPPEHVKFLFATTEPNKIPITILSRCQRFDFAGIEAGSIQARLAQIAAAEGVDIDEAALQTLAMRAAGSMRDSQSLLEQLLAAADARITTEDVNRLLGIAPTQRVTALASRLSDRDAAGALGELDAALSGGADAGQLVDQLLGCYRDLMTLAAGCSEDRMLHALPTQADEMRSLADRLGVQTILAVLQVLDQTAARLRVSVHGRTLAEMAVVRIATLEDLDDLAGLVSTLRDGTPMPERPGAPPNAPPPPRTPTRTAATAGPRTTALPDPSSDLPPDAPPRSLTDQLAERVGTPPPKKDGPTTEAGGKRGEGDNGPSLTEQLNARLSTPDAIGPPASPRKSRRRQEAEVASRPFVQAAMELFDVEPGKLRYTPGEETK